VAPAAGDDEDLPRLQGPVLTAPWAVLFDLDGTLVDTEPILGDALLAVLGELGVPASAVQVNALQGRSVAENLAQLSMLTKSSISAEELYARVNDRILDRLRIGITPLPGAVGLLRALRLARVACALVSSSYREMVDAVLPSLGRAEFAVTIAGDEVRRPKPDPESYRTAAARLGIEPGRCVVIEDSSTGIRSGLAAGCVPVSVAPTREPVALAVDGLSDLTVGRLARLVEADRGARSEPGSHS
jgi:HAD superfamily hydrolase (TIGR01509 family)